MYVLAKNNSIVALDPETGRELWTHTPEGERHAITNRGLNYWASADGSDERLLFCRNHYLVASMHAPANHRRASGRTAGSISSRVSIAILPRLRLVQSLTPGRVFENLFIVGSATNQGYGSAPGDIRAFDVQNGKARVDLPHDPASG